MNKKFCCFLVGIFSIFCSHVFGTAEAQVPEFGVFPLNTVFYIEVPGLDTYYYRMKVEVGNSSIGKSHLYASNGNPISCHKVIAVWQTDADGIRIGNDSPDLNFLGKLMLYAHYIMAYPELAGKMTEAASVKYCCYSKALGTESIYVSDILTSLFAGDFLRTNAQDASYIFHHRSSMLGIFTTRHVSHSWYTGQDGYLYCTGKYDTGPVFSTRESSIENVFNAPIPVFVRPKPQ